MKASKALAVILALLALAGGFAVLHGVLAGAHVYALTHRSKEDLARQDFYNEMQARYKSSAKPRR